LQCSCSHRAARPNADALTFPSVLQFLCAPERRGRRAYPNADALTFPCVLQCCALRSSAAEGRTQMLTCSLSLVFCSVRALQSGAADGRAQMLMCWLHLVFRGVSALQSAAAGRFSQTHFPDCFVVFARSRAARRAGLPGCRRAVRAPQRRRGGRACPNADVLTFPSLLQCSLSPVSACSRATSVSGFGIRVSGWRFRHLCLDPGLRKHAFSSPWPSLAWQSMAQHSTA
jgi:hypothetical protein